MIKILIVNPQNKFNIFKINNCIDEENIFIQKLKIDKNNFFDFLYFWKF